MRCGALTLSILGCLLSEELAHARSCAWIFPRDPWFTPSTCAPLPFPPDTEDQPFRLRDLVHGLTFEQALAARPDVPAGLLRGDFPITREVRAWGLRGVAYHLGRAHEFLRRDLGRRFASRPLDVLLVGEHSGMGTLNEPSIRVGGYGELASEVILHEYAHHVIEWERPGITATRPTGRRTPSPTASSRPGATTWRSRSTRSRASASTCRESGGPARPASFTPCRPTARAAAATRRCSRSTTVSVRSSCSERCSGTFIASPEPASPVALMLDSLGFLDLSRPPGYREAIEALLRADRALHGGRWQGVLIRRARVRFPDLGFDT